MNDVNNTNNTLVNGVLPSDSDLEKVLEVLKADLEKVKNESQSYLDGWRRSKADYQNLKKATDQEREAYIETAKMFLLSDFLEVYDNFCMACKLLESNNKSIDKALYDGIIQVSKQFENLLKKWEVVRMDSVNSVFNPEMHEAISEEQNSLEGTITVDNNTENKIKQIVVKELSVGYTCKGKVIKPAKVIIKNV